MPNLLLVNHNELGIFTIPFKGMEIILLNNGIYFFTKETYEKCRKIICNLLTMQKIKVSLRRNNREIKC